MFGLEKTAVMAIGAGLLILALIGAIIGLINYGQKLGKMEAENTRLENEIQEASDWKDEQVRKFQEQAVAFAALEVSESAARNKYLALLAEPPQIVTRWREVPVEVPVAIPLGDCDKAATNAWDILRDAGIIGDPTWEDTFYSPPSSAWDVLAQEQSLTGPNLYLSLSPSPSPLWNESVGTYHLSTQQPFHVSR